MQAVHCTRERHGDAILAIFNDAILHSTALYEYQPRTAQRIDDWFAAKAQGGFPVLGLEADDGSLAGFGSYGAFRAFPAYKYTVEHSVYVHRSHRGRGIDMDNQASIALHAGLGFTHAGTVRQAGFKFGRWLDVGFYQLILDTPVQPVDG